MPPSLSQVTTIWQRLDRRQRLIVGGGLIAAIAGLLLVVTLGQATRYDVAFSGLTEEEAAAVTERLKELKIPYRLESGGTIRVPAESVAEARVQVAGAGLLRGSGVGFELFDQPSFGLSDFVQRVNYQRALEGEIARTIARMDPVETARVHLAIPRPTLFLNEQKAPSAAVFVQTKPGRQLDSAHVRAITQLVVGAVEGLKPENVSVLDAQGKVLSTVGSTSELSAEQLAHQHEVRRQMETELESNVQRILDQVVGPGKATAKVSLDLNWEQYEATSELYSPGGQEPQLRSIHELRETQGPGATTAGGVPGDANLPTYQQQTTTTTGSSERVESSRDYELSRTVEKVVRSPGAIRRLSVAVLLDSSAVADAAQVQAIEEAVRAAVGLDAERGDTLAVVQVPFQESQEQGVNLEQVLQQQQRWEMIRIAALIVGPALALLLLRLLLRRPRGTALVTPPGAPTVEVPVVMPPEAPLLQPAEIQRRAEIREQIQTIAKDDPAAVAAVIQSWLHEDRRKA
ncbi:MAG TPA: flagellar basal-body MS-ring/collar protein FliF [Chloroflexota bacterium]